MSLYHKILRVQLEEFKEEVCRNPDAGFTPHIQALAAEFGKREKKFAHELFLELYDGDAQSLKMDLCALRSPNPAKTAALPHPADLLLCLYNKLSEPIKENFSTIIAACSQGVEMSQEYYKRILSKFKEEICRNPEADFTPSIKKLVDEIYHYNLKEECKKRAVNVLFLNLYGPNNDSLDRDLIKFRMVIKQAQKAGPPERTALLQLLCGALSPYIQEDFSDLIAMCERKMEDGA